MLGQVVPEAYAVQELETEKEVVPMVLQATPVMVHYSLRMMLLVATPAVSSKHNVFTQKAQFSVLV